MENEVYAFALETALSEIQNLCPEITHSFIFTHDGELLAGDKATDRKTMVRVVDSFDGVLEKADSLGGIEEITLQGSKGRVQVSCINKNLYMVTVTSKKADPTYVNMVSRVLIPTVLKMLEKLNPTSLKNTFPQKNEILEKPKPELEPEPEKPEIDLKLDLPAEVSLEKTEEKEEELSPEPWKPEEEPVLEETEEPELPEKPLEIPTSQLIVDTIGGLLVKGDTVRIDKNLLDEWAELCGEEKIKEVEIETFTGQTVQCKVKPITDSKYKDKGLIRIPEKLRRKLDVKRGELVRVSPWIEPKNEEKEEKEKES